MGQNASGAWLSVPLAEELLAELEQYTLEAPDSFWGSASCARFRWAVNVGRWTPQGGSDGEEFRMLLSLLPLDEQEAVMQYRALSDKKRTLVGRLLSLRACAQALGDSAYEQIQIGRTKGKKPFLHSPLPGSLPNFNFNISHDGSWVVLASDCLYLIGVDVSAPQRERGEHEDETWFQDMSSVLTENERDSIKGGKTHQDRYAIFQRIWSAKEAVSKAIGSGLSFGFERMEVTLPGLEDGGLGNLVLSAIWPRSDEEKPPGKRGRMNFSSLLANLQGGQRRQGETEEDNHPPAPVMDKMAEVAIGKPCRVELRIDQWLRSDWIVEQQEFSGGSWVTVALGPVYDAVDADGIFKTTFRLPGLGGPTNVEGLVAKARTEASRHWIPEAQGFQQLAVDALAPQKVRKDLAALKARLLMAAADPAMGGCTSSSKGKSNKGKTAVASKYKPRPQDGELLTQLTSVSIVDVVNAAGVAGAGPKVFLGAKNDPSPLEMTSFTNKCVEAHGDAMDLLPAGIAFTCRKGLKPDTPNQDTWFVLKMDTFSLYAVFDGHGPNGHEVSQFVKEHLPKLIVQDPRSKSAEAGPCLVDAFMKMQRLVIAAESRRRLQARKSGTTATVALLDHVRSKLTIAHVADSAAALASKEGDKWIAKAVTRDHKPNLKGERERIEKAGAKVGFDGTNHRVYAKDGSAPGLNMSRCLGDTLGHEECGIICEPEITRIKLDSSAEQILLICSDGVWEFMSAQEAIDIVTTRPYDMGDQAVGLLAKESWDRWIKEEGAAVVDDITAGLIYIGKDLQ